MIDNNLIEVASNVNLADYLISRGVQLKKVGQGYIMIQHDSLRFYQNTFNWYSKGEKGNTISFLCKYYKMSFPEAVNELCRFVGFTPDNNHDDKRVIAYLCKKRGLDYNLVTSLINYKLLYQDERGNCNFVIRDFDKYPIGQEIVGTGDKRYKQITLHEGFGFYLTCGNPTDALFFESAIDLLSCFQLYQKKFTHHLLISMGGLNPSVIYNVLSLADFKVWLCVDNDKSGDIFINCFSNCNTFRPKGFKDWNDLLLDIKKSR